MRGKIIKGISGFYYVHDGHENVYECRARGIFRNQKIKPLVGDMVEIDIISEEEMTGNLVDIYPRAKELFRPACANIDQAIVLFAAKDPDPNYIMLDKFLITMGKLELPIILCFNKCELVDEAEIEKLRDIYKDCADVRFISMEKKLGLSEMGDLLRGKTTVLAGPSGAGKSSFTNHFCGEGVMETGTVSKKLGRGRHTTRHAELFYVEDDTFLCDTPGFTSIELRDIEHKDLRFYYPEFDEYEGCCRFQGCVHLSEPDCSVKKAVKEKKISAKRYESYYYIYQELKAIKKY